MGAIQLARGIPELRARREISMWFNQREKLASWHQSSAPKLCEAVRDYIVLSTSERLRKQDGSQESRPVPDPETPFMSFLLQHHNIEANLCEHIAHKHRNPAQKGIHECALRSCALDPYSPMPEGFLDYPKTWVG